MINIGDLIDGNTEDRAAVLGQCEEIRPSIEGSSMPLIYVPGNHDLGNETMRAIGRERYGAHYYHFVYRNVLFIVLNTEAPRSPRRSPRPSTPTSALHRSTRSAARSPGTRRLAGPSC